MFTNPDFIIGKIIMTTICVGVVFSIIYKNWKRMERTDTPIPDLINPLEEFNHIMQRYDVPNIGAVSDIGIKSISLNYNPQKLFTGTHAGRAFVNLPIYLIRYVRYNNRIVVLEREYTELVILQQYADDTETFILSKPPAFVTEENFFLDENNNKSFKSIRALFEGEILTFYKPSDTSDGKTDINNWVTLSLYDSEAVAAAT